MRHILLLASSAMLLISLGLPAYPLRAEEPETAAQPNEVALKHFETHVRPLLAAHCFKCHGEEKQKGGLRLDRPADLLQGGDSGPAVVPGKPAESLLMEAVRYESFEMPPEKQLEDTQVAVLEQWIAAGAPWPNFNAADLANRDQADKFSEEDRAFWSFQPLKRPDVPEVNDRAWSRNAIDRFIVKKLHENGLEPAVEADRSMLLRRAYFDLTGLPPSPEEIDRFLSDDSPQAYEKLIDRLLESPEYGERWARHWLDLVRYAESDGFRQDAYRPQAWRYRDYVIASFNADKPYSQFVTEQLAGDETAPDRAEALVATGYLRHWIYEYNQRDVRTQWTDILNDVTDTTADVFLAMGVSCARCHDHKFDPILRNDYYRLQAFFTPILPRDDIPAASAAERKAFQQQQDKWLAATAEIRAELDAMNAPFALRAAESAITKFPPDIEAMMRKPVAERDPLEAQLAALAWNQVTIEQEKVSTKVKDEQKERYEELVAKLAKFEDLKPKALPSAMTVTDVGPTPPPTTIPGVRRAEPIPPGYLTMLDPTSAAVEPLPNSSGRRTALAKWITEPENPLTWRVIVNRVWQQHFGRGIVSSTSDFGRLGTKPTHPELLDYLATEFVANGESFKKLHRLIMTSATYRQTSLRVTGEREDMIDPTSELLWRMVPRRLDSEQIRDSLLAVSGQFDSSRGGGSASPSSNRRSIYCKVIRNSPDPLLKEFDAAPGFSSTSQRNVTTTPTQSLLMINGSDTLRYAGALSKRTAKAGSEEDRIRQVYKLAYAREPQPLEIQRALEFLTGRSEEEAGESKSPEQLPTSPLVKEFGAAAKLSRTDAPQRIYLPDAASLPKGDFTFEAIVQLESVYSDATVCTIASWWDSSSSHPGWSLGVTSEQSRYKPRNLIVQLVGTADSGGLKYEVIPSDMHLQLKRPYYVAVSVKLSDTKPSGITFYLQDLSKPGGELKTAQVAHSVVSGYANEGKFLLGGRHGSSQHRWHGQLDEVRFSRESLSREQLLASTEPKKVEPETIVGYWQFNRAEAPLADSSSQARQLTYDALISTPSLSVNEAAWLDFCHVILNSNEFLYVD